MVNGIGATEQVRHELSVAHIPQVEVDSGAQVGRAAVPVHWWGQGVEDGDVVALRQ